MLYVFNVYVPPPLRATVLVLHVLSTLKCTKIPHIIPPKYVFLYLLNLVQPLPKTKKFEIPLSS